MKLVNKIKYDQQMAQKRLNEANQQLKKVNLLKMGAQDDQVRYEDLEAELKKIEEQM